MALLSQMIFETEDACFSTFQLEFVHGSVVILESCASGKTLRSFHGKAEGIGGRGAHGQYVPFFVRVATIILYVGHLCSQFFFDCHYCVT